MPSSRRHDIDALRVLLFALLIVYHVCMLYVAGWSFHVKSDYLADWLQAPMLLVNRWRMPLLFVISGIALRFAHDRGRWALVAGRTRRVLVPLVFGILVVVPIQPYCQGVTNHLVEPGFGRFLLRYYRFQPWPKGAFDGWQYGFTWNHLWYLAYLWVYSLLLVAAMPLLESRIGIAVRRAATRLRGGWFLVLPALPKVVALALLADAHPPTDNLVDDWYQHALYFSYFVLGWVVALDEDWWTALKSWRRRTLALAVCTGFAYVLIVQHLFSDETSGWPLLGVRVLSGLNTWFWIAALLGWSATLLDRPFRWLPYANEAVLPWYLLHQSLIVFVAYLLIPLKVGPVLEPFVVFAATVSGCALLHEFVVRRFPMTRRLFGLKPLVREAVPLTAGTVDTPRYRSRPRADTRASSGSR